MSSKRSCKSVFDVLGIRLDERSPTKPGIEDLEIAILEVIYIAENDLRVFSLLVSWSKIHSDAIIYEKLEKHYKEYKKFKGETLVYDIFLIFCSTFGKRRIKNRISRRKKPIMFPDKSSTKTMLKRSSPISELKEFNILIPEKSARIRESDILSVKELAKENQQYRNRYIFGACWRSDIIYEIDRGASSPYQISKKIGCSYEPANRIWNDYHAI